MRDQIISRPAEPAERFAIPLDEAWYCESCRVVLNHAACFCCASSDHTQRLAPWLDREYEPLRIPLSGVFLSVTPIPKKLPQEAEWMPHRLPRAS